MPDTAMETKYDLRKPGAWDKLNAKVDAFVKAQGKEDFTAAALAKACKCNMSQARRALDVRISDGVLDYEGTTRDMVYRKAKRKK